MSGTGLSDRWSTRDFPVLLEVARVLDGRHRPPDERETFEIVSEALDFEQEDVETSCRALVEATYLRREVPTMDSKPVTWWQWGWFVLTERGRRAVGLWPSGEGVDALVDALRQAEAETTDPEEKGRIRQAAASVMGVSRDVMVDVLGAVIARQSGMG